MDTGCLWQFEFVVNIRNLFRNFEWSQFLPFQLVTMFHILQFASCPDVLLQKIHFIPFLNEGSWLQSLSAYHFI